jgi:hypothetical protein
LGVRDAGERLQGSETGEGGNGNKPERDGRKDCNVLKQGKDETPVKEKDVEITAFAGLRSETVSKWK